MALDLRNGTRRTLPQTCHVTNRRDDQWYLTCSTRQHFSSIDRLAADDTTETIVAPPVATGPNRIGSFQKAFLSPDGTTFLIEMGTGCEVPKVVFADFLGHVLTPEGRDANEALESEALGWTARGDAVIHYFPSGCADGPAGIYLAQPGREPSLVYQTKDTVDQHVPTAMWKPMT